METPRLLTIGSFDLKHVGHQRLFDRCAALGKLSVGVNSDRFIREYKTVEPAENETVRMLNVANSLGVGHVSLNDGPGIDLIRKLKPDILVVGSDWHGNGYESQIGSTDDELFETLGLSILYVPRTPGVSSTQIREQRAGEAQL